MGWGGARTNSGRKKKAAGNDNAPGTPKPEGRQKTWLPSFEEIAALVESSRRNARAAPRTPANCPFRIAEHPKTATPKTSMALDSALMANNDWAANAWLSGEIMVGVVGEGLSFPGYAYLAELAQRPEYRLMTEIIATEATRKWIRFKSIGKSKKKNGKKDVEIDVDESPASAADLAPDLEPDAGSKEDDDDSDPGLEDAEDNAKTEKIKELVDFLDDLKARSMFCEVANHDGFFGRGHLYLDAGDGKDEELKMPIGSGRDAFSEGKVGRGFLKKLRTIEPVWTYPQAYNAQNPLDPDWYNPQQWFVMGREIHATRLLKFVSRPVPDMLKPAYSFGGLSMSQMAQPYVDIWLRTRASVAEIIHSFSVMVLMTDLQTLLQPGSATNILARVAMFNAFRDNQGAFVINKATEDFKNVAAPVGGLHELQAQAQEHMAFIGRYPLVKFTGIQPAGLNASSEGEIRTFYDNVGAYQESFIRPGLQTVVDFAMITLWGARDPDIVFEFVPLWSMSEKEEGEVRKSDAETDQIRIDSGVVSPEEVRQKVVTDPASKFNGLDPADVPDLQAEEEAGLQPGGEGGGGEPGGGGGSFPGGGGGEGGADDAALASDDWSESDHPRGQPGNAGQFGSGGGGSGTKPSSGGTKGGGSGIPGFLKRTPGSSPGQRITAPQYGMPHGEMTATHGGSSSSPGFTPKAKKTNIGEVLDPAKLKKVGKQMGSNPGGVYEDEAGKKFYVKQGKSKDHVRNEMIAAALYDLAGTPTLKYRPTPEGTHIATEIEKLDKDNASKLSPDERREAAADFAVHAWLGNWDAVGLGGDNLGTVNGVPTPLDLGGALEYRAMGGPKGKAFGDQVGELDSLRDPKVNKDSAGVFGPMTPAELRKSARYVVGISDSKIRDAVKKQGGSEALADKLIARKADVAKRARSFGAEGDPRKPGSTMVIPAGEATPVKELNGVKFAAWRPPTDWAAVDGQIALEEPEFDPKNKSPSSGVVIREPDGRVWLVQPRGGYGGYEATFPKGGVEKGLSMQANAIKEAYEESGLKVRITGFLGDHEGDATMTRYYTAEREGGDPSQHDDESEGVVLVPKDKADGFVNRARDRNVVGSLKQAGDEWALDEFKESDHPRDDGGKFAESGSGGSSGGESDTGGGPKTYEDFVKQVEKAKETGNTFVEENLKKYNPDWAKSLAAEPPTESKAKKTAFGGLWKSAGDNPAANFHVNAVHVLGKPANAGQSYRQMLTFMIKEASKHGHESLVPALKAKLADALVNAYQKSIKDGKHDDAHKIAVKIKEAGIPLPLPGETPEPQVAKGKTFQEWKQEQPSPAESEATAQIYKELEKETAAKKEPPKPPPAPPKFPAPTAAEIEKAKKNVALQLQYVPGAPQGSAVAQKLVDEFNKKYAGKVLESQPALIQKVNDFKAMQAAMVPLMSAQQQEAAKQAAAEAEKNAAQHKKNLQQQKAALEAAKEKNAGVMKDLGISETEATGFHALVQMIGGKTADVVAQFKSLENDAKKLGYEMTGFQYALLRNYIDGGYQSVNNALRSLHWTPAQHVYARLVNKALDKVPKYTGTVTRGTSLTEEQLAAYKPGHVMEEKAFTSSGIGYKFSGNVHYTIQATGKRGANLSKGANTHEKEVLFKAKTYFLVHKVEKKGGTTYIEMEEVDSYD